MKPTIASLLAEITSCGWDAALIDVAAGFDNPVYDIVLTEEGQLHGHALRISPGDDEQLRAALQSLINEIVSSR